jgi:hypothetical protein
MIRRRTTCTMPTPSAGAGAIFPPETFQGHLAHNDSTPPQDPRVALCLGTYSDPRGWLFLMRTVPLYGCLYSGPVQPFFRRVVPGRAPPRSLLQSSMYSGPSTRLTEIGLQEYLAHQKQQPPRTLQWDHAPEN